MDENVHIFVTFFLAEPVCDTVLTEDEVGTSNDTIALTYTNNSHVFDYYTFTINASGVEPIRKEREDSEKRVVFKVSEPGEVYLVTVTTTSGDQTSGGKAVVIRASK